MSSNRCCIFNLHVAWTPEASRARATWNNSTLSDAETRGLRHRYIHTYRMAVHQHNTDVQIDTSGLWWLGSRW